MIAQALGMIDAGFVSIADGNCAHTGPRQPFGFVEEFTQAFLAKYTNPLTTMIDDEKAMARQNLMTVLTETPAIRATLLGDIPVIAILFGLAGAYGFWLARTGALAVKCAGNHVADDEKRDGTGQRTSYLVTALGARRCMAMPVRMNVKAVMLMMSLRVMCQSSFFSVAGGQIVCPLLKTGLGAGGMFNNNVKMLSDNGEQMCRCYCISARV